MRFSISLLTSFLLVVASLNAQRQAENWHFGKGISLSFASGNPVLAPPSAMDAFEGIVAYSDTLGKLLFYTNGGGRVNRSGTPPELEQNTGLIWNRNHEVMYDMRGVEGGGFSARQSAIAMPDPAGEPGIYYLFTMEEAEFDVDSTIALQPLGRGLSFFIIDMNLNGGLGGVRTADQRVFVPAYEALDATPMADGSGYWIICHNDNAELPRFIVTPLTAAGIGTPVTYPTRIVSGKLEFSPDGSMLYHRGTLFSFDNATGAIGAALGEFPNAASQAACFTPDSRFLYATENRTGLGEVIVRYDLEDFSTQLIERLADSPDRIVFTNAPFQIGPNGNIYFVEQTVATGGDIRYGLSEITCVSSPTPGINRYLIDLPIPADSAGFLPQSLPQYVDAIFSTPPVPDTLRLPQDTIFVCGQDTTVLRNRESGLAYRWSTGATTDSISVSIPGTYCLTITNECTPTVDCRVVLAEDPAFMPLLLEQAADQGCAGVFSTYDLNLAGVVREATVTITAEETDGTATLLYEETFTQSVISIPQFPEDRVTTLSISVSTAYCTDLFWSQQIEPFTDERFAPELEVSFPDAACSGELFVLEVTNSGSLDIAAVRWPDGNTDNPRTQPATFGESYAVEVLSECGETITLMYGGEDIAEFCDCIPQIPELITPNGDGRNEVFRLFANCPVAAFTLLIYNRWGQPVFETNDPERGWDGTLNGTPQNADTYLYRMAFRFPNADAVVVKEGQFSLLR